MNDKNTLYNRKSNICRKYLIPGAAVLLSFSVTACAGNSRTEEKASSAITAETESETVTGTMENREAESLSETDPSEAAKGDNNAAGESGKESEEETSEQEGGMNHGAGVPNPIQKVNSSSDFETLSLKLELPASEWWYSDPVYTVIAGKVAQIQFYDEITESDAIVRAGKSEEDISGIYYVFDDSKKQSWSTKLEDGTLIDIMVQVAAENSDVHGVLATWSCRDINYSLWEDDAWEYPDAVAKMAISIMERSDPERAE